MPELIAEKQRLEQLHIIGSCCIGHTYSTKNVRAIWLFGISTSKNLSEKYAKKNKFVFYATIDMK